MCDGLLIALGWVVSRREVKGGIPKVHRPNVTPAGVRGKANATKRTNKLRRAARWGIPVLQISSVARPGV